MPQKKKTKGLRRGKYGGQAIGPPHPICLPGYVTRRWLLTAIEKYAGAPSCTNSTFWCSVSGTPCNNSGRTCCWKTRYFEPMQSLDSIRCFYILLTIPLIGLFVLPMATIIAIFSDKGNCTNLKQAKVESNYLVWNKKVPDTELEKFKKIIEKKYNLKFQTYWDLHSWSVTNFTSFWEEVWNYSEIISSRPYDEVFVKNGPGFLDNVWFKGAAFNYAENVLRIRDDREALLCLDEEGNFEKVTFAEMFEEVKLYSASFRKHGLQKGDRVACYMSNRKEAIFAMLATLSIGAIWGGPQPFLGATGAANVVATLGAKFLITVDSFVEDGEEYRTMDNLPVIAENAPTLEKIIIVPTKEETLSKDISHIPNSYLLGPFLEKGKTPEGEVPDIVFEQLPFNHPVTVAFTSGTSAMPKGAVHTAGEREKNKKNTNRSNNSTYGWKPFRVGEKTLFFGSELFNHTSQILSLLQLLYRSSTFECHLGMCDPLTILKQNVSQANGKQKHRQGKGNYARTKAE
ncbi:acetoacetyl-CoA synthetase [Trichonephila clavipes]|nr:acetoacetyl-CoA synthetase [Trichonephila clavipes]